MSTEIDDLTELAYEGGAPLTTVPVLGSPGGADGPRLMPDVEPVRDGEVRVTVLGSGDPFVKHSQASASLLIEVGNPERDLFFFDLGSGALANYNGIGLPVTKTTKVLTMTSLIVSRAPPPAVTCWNAALTSAAPAPPAAAWV